MAETQSKRHRGEENSHEPHQSFEFESDSNSKSKRHKSYDNILSILDEESEENEPNHDLSAIFSTFENELSTTTTTTTTTTVTAADAAAATDEQDDNQSSSAAAAAAGGSKGEDDDSIKVIRHLLEASDDELGIPNFPDNGVDEEINSGNYNGLINASFDGFWELEDEAANYYTVLQSELFM